MYSHMLVNRNTDNSLSLTTNDSCIMQQFGKSIAPLHVTVLSTFPQLSHVDMDIPITVALHADGFTWHLSLLATIVNQNGLPSFISLILFLLSDILYTLGVYLL